jgi:transposase
LSTKIHALVDALGNPTAFLLTAGQAHDLEGADCFLPQLNADALLADKAFDADKRVIEPLQAAGITPVIPSVPGRSIRRAYDRDLYKQRHLIENFFCKLKQFRAIATRYDKRASNFLAGVYAASILIWLNGQALGGALGRGRKRPLSLGSPWCEVRQAPSGVT